MMMMIDDDDDDDDDERLLQQVFRIVCPLESTILLVFVASKVTYW